MVPALIQIIRDKWSRAFVRPQSPDPAKQIIKKTDGVNYIADLIDLIGLKLVRMHEAKGATEPCFYIRHDVDRDIERALDIAEVEAARGYTATYFMLTPGSYDQQRNYYGTLEDGRIIHDPTLVDKCHRLIALGHDIGFHNDLVSLSLRTGRSPAQLLEGEVEFFAEHDIPLRGTAAHGNPLARQLQYSNRELFVGQIRVGRTPGREINYEGRCVRLHSLPLQDYGFDYEAYTLPRDSRLSDSGGRWAGLVAGQRPPQKWLEGEFDIQEFRAFVSRGCAAQGVKAMSLLTHPCHWDVPCP